MNPERIYAQLPIAAQHLAVSMAGWRTKRRRFDGEFAALLERYLDRTALGHEQVRAFRDGRLASFVENAARDVVGYRAAFARTGIRPNDIRGMADLAALPILTRPQVQESIDDFTSNDGPAMPTLICHTSGSTGTGLRFPVTWQSHKEQWAVWWRYRSWHGITRETTCLYFGGRSIVPLRQRQAPFWRYNRPGRQVLFSAYHLSDDTARSYLDEMRATHAEWIHGYPSVIALIARYALELRRRPRIRWVTLGAENVLDSQRSVIREAFGVEPLEHYGLAEGAANASQCPNGRLHVDEDFAAVEFVPLGNDRYRIVGTNFTNPAMPLIRYDTGDIATIEDESCDCGRPGRVVRRIDGRKEDYVVTRSGARLGRLDHIFKDLTRIREAQIHQDEPGFMTLVVVRGRGYGPEDERRLREETLQRVGDEVAFEIEYTEALPRTKRGKLRFVVSSVAAGDLSAASSPTTPDG
jgi:phenylacetate-CoA ligase